MDRYRRHHGIPRIGWSEIMAGDEADFEGLDPRKVVSVPKKKWNRYENHKAKTKCRNKMGRWKHRVRHKEHQGRSTNVFIVRCGDCEEPLAVFYLPPGRWTQAWSSQLNLSVDGIRIYDWDHIKDGLPYEKKGASDLRQDVRWTREDRKALKHVG